MNIICIVQARMGSERLPGKVLKKINDIPLIQYTISRLKKSKYINKVILATSTLAQDDLLYKYAVDNNVECFRGSEDNVLERYVKCVETHNGDIILRVTGDCPLIDPVVVDNAVTKFLMNKYDYLRLDVPETFVRGFDVEILTKDALNKTWNEVSSKYYNEISRFHEHVTLYIYENKERFSVGYLKNEEALVRDYRLCVDTIEDFNLVENIINNLDESRLNYIDIIEYLDKNKEVAEINSNIEQKHA